MRECLDSLVNQTYKNMEIIVVNDGSTDMSAGIVTQYQKKYKNIKLINQENQGVSLTRNNGIKAAKGEYIAFVDCDDLVELNTYELIIRKMIEKNADIAVFRYIRFNGKNNKIEKYGVDVEKEYNQVEALENYFSTDETQKLGEANWNKVFKKNIIGDIRFEKIRIGEDYLFNYNVFKNADKIINIPEFLYKYRITENSATTSAFNLDKLNEYIYSRKVVLEDIKIKYPKLYDNAYFQLCESYYYSILKFGEELNLKKEKLFIKLRNEYQEFANTEKYENVYNCSMHGQHLKKFIQHYKIYILINSIKRKVKSILHSKKKIAILTINDNDNYGNRLQNYALLQYLTQNGYNAEAVKNHYYDIGFFTYYKYLIKNVIRNLFFYKLKRYQRKINFSKFEKNIKYSKIKILKNSIPKNLDKKYECFIVGSDQVWNPKFERTSKIDFLTFASQEKRYSYAASIGIDNIPKEYKENYKKYLSQFNKISVREDRAKKCVEELTGRDDIEIHVDPTMLLTKTEWEKVMKKPSIKLPNKYILSYFLGNISAERQKAINEYAQSNKLEIIELLNPSSPYNVCGPSEFVYLEKNAELICTDSFHSSIFAIIFEKKFLVFDREQANMENMNSRIETLLKKYQLETQLVKNNIIEKAPIDIDYKKVEGIIAAERQKAKYYFEKNL